MLGAPLRKTGDKLFTKKLALTAPDIKNPFTIKPLSSGLFMPGPVLITTILSVWLSVPTKSIKK